MKKIFILKSILKDLASKIRKTKVAFKDHQRKNWGYAGPFHEELSGAQYEFRHKHIAYCLLRGTLREKIETLPKNPERKKFIAPNENYIQEVLNEYREAVPENVCSGS